MLGFRRLTETERVSLERFFYVAEVLPLSETIVQRAIRLRQQRRMGLGDSLVAATALVHDSVLATRNTEDFHWIEALSLLDPFVPPA